MKNDRYRAFVLECRVCGNITVDGWELHPILLMYQMADPLRKCDKCGRRTRCKIKAKLTRGIMAVWDEKPNEKTRLPE